MDSSFGFGFGILRRSTAYIPVGVRGNDENEIETARGSISGWRAILRGEFLWLLSLRLHGKYPTHRLMAGKLSML